MSDVSQGLLRSKNKGVHKQLDFLLAAMHTQLLLQSGEFHVEIEGATSKEIKRWIKTKLAAHMKLNGYYTWFLSKELLFYVFQLYEHFYEQYSTLLEFKENTPLTEVQYSIILLAASFLDDKFVNTGMADVCSFLEQNLNSKGIK